jgi:sortase B
MKVIRPKKPKLLYGIFVAMLAISAGMAVWLVLQTSSAPVVPVDVVENIVEDLVVEIEITTPTIPPPTTTAHLEPEPEEEPDISNDIVGRIWIPGTTIDYYVVQGEDNDFFLHHDINREPQASGAIFLDYAVDLARDNQNIVIYGHNMRTRTKFHDLRHFADYNFFRENSTIYFSTPHEDTTWEVFAFYTAHISFPYTHINFENDELWAIMLASFAEASIHAPPATLSPDDRILTLSTCSGGDRDMRFVLQARRIID